jgi:hypothetical protein
MPNRIISPFSAYRLAEHVGLSNHPVTYESIRVILDSIEAHNPQMHLDDRWYDSYHWLLKNKILVETVRDYYGRSNLMIEVYD